MKNIFSCKYFQLFLITTLFSLSFFLQNFPKKKLFFINIPKKKLNSNYKKYKKDREKIFLILFFSFLILFLLILFSFFISLHFLEKNLEKKINLKKQKKHQETEEKLKELEKRKKNEEEKEVIEGDFVILNEDNLQFSGNRGEKNIIQNKTYKKKDRINIHDKKTLELIKNLPENEQVSFNTTQTIYKGSNNKILIKSKNDLEFKKSKYYELARKINRVSKRIYLREFLINLDALRFFHYYYFSYYPEKYLDDLFKEKNVEGGSIFDIFNDNNINHNNENNENEYLSFPFVTKYLGKERTTKLKKTLFEYGEKRRENKNIPFHLEEEYSLLLYFLANNEKIEIEKPKLKNNKEINLIKKEKPGRIKSNGFVCLPNIKLFSKKSVIRKRFAKKDYDYNVCQYVKYLFLTIVNNNDSNFFNENIEKKSFLKYYFFDYLGFKKKDIKIVCEILGKEKKEVENIFKLEISEDEKKYFKDALNKNNISCFPYEVRKDREKNDSAIYKFFEKFYDYGDKEFDDQKVWFFYKFQQKVREKIDIRHNLNIIDKTINKIKIEKIKNFFSKFKKYKKNNDVENKLINKDEDNSIIKKKCLKIKKIKKIKIQKNQGNQRKPIQNNLLINEGKDENKKPKKIKIQKIIIQKENNSSKDKLLKNPEKFLKQTIKNRELIRKGKVFKKYFSIFKKKVIPEENKNDENEEEKEDKRPDTFLEAID